MFLDSIEELVELVKLEELDSGLFRGQNYQTPWRRVFGGQVLAQALSAAYQTVPEDRFAHSFHAYFILAGKVDQPIIYQVETLRDGGSFTTRRVKAIQNGKAIFIMAASFQLQQEGVDHHIAAPEVTSFKNLKTEQEQAEMIKEIWPDRYIRIKARNQNAIEFRPVESFEIRKAELDNALVNVWLKTTKSLEMSLPLQHQLLAFASDYDLLMSSIVPHSDTIDFSKLFVASLDHAMYFHRPYDINDWMLFSIQSPSASNSRGLGYGQMFSDGKLVATVVQEGLLRIRR